ncbi:type 1 glutamine amidotransferase [Sporolactobacillus spathodeae]|uniref:GMP synthase (Glutamine-hydrolyzing) n=1 Tax=Sporolactobacillus spathodeae TaxID=1465502 RepID=A0ABS2Q9N7_9BACL|nr:type 1 glutamine amidotransferase [Sporolactobacillus spathodeae]MBM7657687.1 GMP synthase (glutamine-hydrolyzing) [Sporolactobacillus spathodeae]
MRIDVFQHVACEGPAAISDWAASHQDQLVIHKLFENDAVPPGDTLEFLVILGGPMSVNDQGPAWITEERRCIAEALTANVPVFGVCLGAQQIAKTLGATVGVGKKEVGWFPIRRTATLLPFLPETLTPLHWHGETFGVPEGAVRLFESDACANQGFVYKCQAVGLQFHMEAKTDSVASLLEHDRDYIDASPYVQTAEEIAKFPMPEENQQTLFQLLNWLRRSNKK